MPPSMLVSCIPLNAEVRLHLYNNMHEILLQISKNTYKTTYITNIWIMSRENHWNINKWMAKINAYRKCFHRYRHKKGFSLFVNIIILMIKLHKNSVLNIRWTGNISLGDIRLYVTEVLFVTMNIKNIFYQALCIANNMTL